MNRPGPPQGPPAGRFDAGIVTPSKPERWNGANPGARQSLPPNVRQNPLAVPNQGRPMPVPGQPQGMPPNRPPIPQARPGPGVNIPNPHAQQPVQRDGPAGLDQGTNQPPPGSQSMGFFSARAADSLRDNPNGAPLQGTQFDPHSESPSIRKTAGVDHTKSVPISKPMLSSASPAANNSRDYVNPAADLQRKVGAPGAPSGSPLSRGPSTSSYRPLTRPNIDPKNVPNPAAMNPNGKRPPLNDVTNSDTVGQGSVPPMPGPNDPKRPRVASGPPGPQQ